MKRVRANLLRVLESNDKLLKIIWIYFWVISIGVFIYSFAFIGSSVMLVALIELFWFWVKNVFCILVLYLLVTIRMNLREKDL
ncbi:hypothetical protein KHQ82_05000 [Mycoplasmatota bacterium]|nr:hypothetical protein KHQ82_05000 [Mycoplasmatota bacterium]